MICVIPFHTGDVNLAQDLLRWIEDLGGCQNHDALLVVDRSVQWSTAIAALTQANKCFRRVTFAVPDVPYDFGWPQGANAMFKFAAKHIEENFAEHWLWLEPDAAPLKSGWLDALDAAYKTCGKRFMGAVYRSNNPNIQIPVLSGVAVYPNECMREVEEATKGIAAFDVILSQILNGDMAHTDLIHWVWGEKREIAPRFAEINEPGTEIFCLKQLKKEAVLFHRCKDGSLIRLLREQMFPKNDNFVVAYPFFPMDAPLALKNIRWMRELRQPRTHEIRLFYETTTDRKIVNEIAEAASPIFSAVKHTPYKPVNGPNAAWKVVAYEMQRVKRSWLWMEPDAIPLRQDWLMTLQTKYSRCGKPFFGPIVPDMRHLNGTAIYPWNTPELCPRTFASGDIYGFDVLMSGEILSLIHDASDVFHHTWVERNGQLKPHGEGEYPTFPNAESVKRLKKGSVLFHRNKDGTLIDRLREAQRV
jgi:hypothetical protein